MTCKIMLRYFLTAHNPLLPLKLAVALPCGYSPVLGAVFLWVFSCRTLVPQSLFLVTCVRLILVCFLDKAPLQSQFVDHLDRRVIGFPKSDTSDCTIFFFIVHSWDPKQTTTPNFPYMLPANCCLTQEK